MSDRHLHHRKELRTAHKNAKLLAGAIVAAIVTAFTAGIASANTITAEPSGAITATSENKITFEASEIVIECRWTLRGNVERTINNTGGGRVGSITAGTLNECGAFQSSRALFISPSTWTLELEGSTRLEGAIDLTTINAVPVNLEIETFGIRCLYRGLVAMQLEGEGSPMVTRRLRLLANVLIYQSGHELCIEEGELAGSFNITRQTLRL